MHSFLSRKTSIGMMPFLDPKHENLPETIAEFDSLLLLMSGGIDVYIMHAIEGGSFTLIKIPAPILPTAPNNSELSLAEQFPQLSNIETIETASRRSLEADKSSSDLRAQFRSGLKLNFEYVWADKHNEESPLNGYYLTLSTK